MVASHNTAQKINKTFSKLLGRPVHAEAVSRETWEVMFKAQGSRSRAMHSDARRFNEGWIEFESDESGSIKGEVELETVLKSLVERAN